MKKPGPGGPVYLLEKITPESLACHNCPVWFYASQSVLEEMDLLHGESVGELFFLKTDYFFLNSFNGKLVNKHLTTSSPASYGFWTLAEKKS